MAHVSWPRHPSYKNNVYVGKKIMVCVAASETPDIKNKKDV